MKKFLATITALFIFGFIIHLSNSRKTKVVIDFDTKGKKEVIRLGPAATTTIAKATEESTSEEVTRAPAQVFSKRKISLQPQFDSSLLDFDYSITSDVHILRNIYAVSQKSYQPSMGRVISGDGRHYFVQSMKENSEQRPAVYDSSSKKIQPLSYLIKISEATTGMREELLARGFKESLYMPEVGLLYLEASKSNYSDIFESLKNQGYRPEYQLLNRDQVGH